MSSLSTFINMFEQFVNELVDTFPEHKPFQSYKMKFEIIKKSNPKQLLNVFMEHVSPYQMDISNKNEQIIIENKVKFLEDIDFNLVWDSDECNENTKTAIWAHLNTLLFFGGTINSIPDDLMGNIEKLAQQYATQMQGNEQMNDMDPSMLIQNMQTMQNMLSGMQNIQQK